MEEQPELTEEQIEELKEQQADEQEDADEDRTLNDSEYRESYGYPEEDKRHNQHTFLNKAAFESQDSTKTTFLRQEELGRPLFSVRFLKDMEVISEHYLDWIAKELGCFNRVRLYFKNKAMNITDTGMSNEGFSMNLNVTRKMDSTRTKIKNPIQNLQGGKKKR